MEADHSSSALYLVSALVVKSPFDADIIPRFTQEGGRIKVDWNPTSVLIDRINSGLRADVMLLTVEAMDRFIESGIADASTRVDLLQSEIGLAVKKGAPKPDIGTVDAMTATLLQARSVAYSLGGASGIYFGKLIERLGIAEPINARATTIPEGFTAEKLVTGEADLAVQQISELLSVAGIDVIGPLPSEVQKTTSFAVACFTDAPNHAAGKHFIAHLTSKASRIAYQSFGLAPSFA